MTKSSQFAGLSSFSWIPVLKGAEYDGGVENKQDMPFCKLRV
jgi:hypothetical protein